MIIWASDKDVIDPMTNLPTHNLQTYHAETQAKLIDWVSFNAMLSAEIGIQLDSKMWIKSKQRVVVDEAHTARANVHYRLALFADYGLTNLHAYRANPIPYNGHKEGGLIQLQDMTQLDSYSILGYELFQDRALNNLFIGMKLSI